VTAEHRNMLIDDALVMLAKSFAEYNHGRQTKSDSSAVKFVSAGGPAPSAQSTSSGAVPSLDIVAERLRPDAATRRLLGLLSADCELTHSELEHLVSYLKFRQTALVSRRASSPDSSSAQHGSDRGGRTAEDSARFVNNLMLEVAKLAARPR